MSHKQAIKKNKKSPQPVLIRFHPIPVNSITEIKI